MKDGIHETNIRKERIGMMGAETAPLRVQIGHGAPCSYGNRDIKATARVATTMNHSR